MSLSLIKGAPPSWRRVKSFSLLFAEARRARLKKLAPANLLLLDDWLIQPLIAHIHVRLEHLFTSNIISHNRNEHTTKSENVNP